MTGADQPSAAPGSILARDAGLDDLAVVAGWVHDADECRLWAGPEVSYPIDVPVLAVEIDLDRSANVVLEDESGPVAFGQVLWFPPDRAHLGRVIVRPDARGRRLGALLVWALLERATAAGASRVTLAVYEENLPARRLYAAAGFTEQDPRESARLRGALFLSLDLT